MLDHIHCTDPLSRIFGFQPFGHAVLFGKSRNDAAQSVSCCFVNLGTVVIELFEEYQLIVLNRVMFGEKRPVQPAVVLDLFLTFQGDVRNEIVYVHSFLWLIRGSTRRCCP